MIPGSTRTAAGQLETLFRLGTLGALTDAQLLERFLADRGEDAEAAFAAVVERHGPMVLRVCRRILADPNDAEDAFQVTFLVLARKARSIARRALLANWLYGVAVRSAREVRKNAARRRAREEPMHDMQPALPPPAEDSGELRGVIDEELSRLPDSFRAPVILCDLEGKTHKEAAAILGMPVGTVSSRLVRARDLLRPRLARRGLDPSAADPPREFTPMAVSPALIATTSRAAVRLAAGAPFAGAVPAYLTTLTEGVLKTMLIAKLTSKGVIAATVLSLSVGAAALGVVSHVLLGAALEPFAFAGPDDREWAWVDRLQNADLATKERLKRCAGSATSNFASLHRMSFDYELIRETWRQPLGADGKVKGVDRQFARGTVYWKDGTVRYDHYPLGTLDPNGRKRLYKRPRVFSVLRSREMLAYTENSNPVYGLMLTVDKPPASAGDWEYQHPFAPMPRLDPWLHYAGPFCQDRAQLRDVWEQCGAIESDEADGRVLLRFLRADNGGRTEVTCEEVADWLPVRLRSGPVQNGEWNVVVDLLSEWQKRSGVWYPVHQVKTSYIGIDMTPVKEIDLTVKNLRASGAVNLPDSVFSLSAMAIPDGTPGSDRRRQPFRNLIKAGGVVRDRRPGEGPSPRNVEQGKAEREKDEETIPADESGGAVTTASAAKVTHAKQAYLALLEEYDPQHRIREKAVFEAKSERSRRETYLALARLDWDYAPRFLELARRHADDPVAIDALAWLVANEFDPPGSHQAADILIRDHLASDKMIAIYRQLVRTLDPAPESAGERLLRAAVVKAPTAEARGLASLKLAELLLYRANAVRKRRGPEPEPFLQLSDLARSGGQAPAKRPDEDPDALAREAERFYDLVVQRYADIPGRSGKLGDWAAKALFQLRDLALGRPAPEVEGPDVDGKPLRLGDYRGRVVVLIFGSGPSGPSGDMYAQGRALNQRLNGRPFAVLSVHLDDSKETVIQAIRAGEITWRCIWEGHAERPNCDRWHVGFIPSVYVIDADGVIRAKDVKGKALDEAVDALLATMNRPAAAGPRSKP